MKAKVLISVLGLIAFSSVQLKAEDGGQLFRTNCGACHTVGKGKLVGPDLKGVETRHTDEWIHKWVKSSQGLVQAGDKDAVKLFADNSSIVMPDQALSDDQISSIVTFIKGSGLDAATASTAVATTTTNSSGTDNVNAAVQKAAQEQKSEGSLLTTFSFTEYLLMFLMGILLIAIYIMGMSIKSLAEKLKNSEAR